MSTFEHSLLAGAMRPFARSTWEYEGRADERTVTAGVSP